MSLLYHDCVSEEEQPKIYKVLNSNSLQNIFWSNSVLLLPVKQKYYMCSQHEGTVLKKIQQTLTYCS